MADRRNLGYRIRPSHGRHHDRKAQHAEDGEGAVIRVRTSSPVSSMPPRNQNTAKSSSPTSTQTLINSDRPMLVFAQYTFHVTVP